MRLQRAAEFPFCLSFLALVVLVALGRHGSLLAQDVLITEIHYHPPTAQGEAEFIELFNSHPLSVDVSRFFFLEGVAYVFPEGSVIPARGYFIVARDPDHLRSLHGLSDNVPLFGPFVGRLANEGESIVLANPVGRSVFRVRYNNRGRWPVAAAGAGHTLELRNPWLDPRSVESWKASDAIGGTPGRAPQDVATSEPRETVVLVPAGASWRYLKGTAEPPADWAQPDFRDSSWPTGPSGFGYGDGDDATELLDMQGTYLSLYLRTEFALSTPRSVRRLILRVDFDDGFVAYLNGAEVVRAGLGAPGDPVPHDARALPHEAGTPEEYDITRRSGLLVGGANVLALQAHNSTVSSSDFTVVPELVLERGEEPAAFPVRLRAVRFGPDVPPSERWLELVNESASAVDLAGHSISSDADALDLLTLASGSKLAPGAFLLLEQHVLPFSLGTPNLRLFLSSLEPPRVLQAVHLDAPADPSGHVEKFPGEGRLEGEDEWLFVAGPETVLGRPRPPTLVLNEIHYHSLSPLGDPEEEYVEVHNFGEQALELTGYSLAEGIDYSFPDGTIIPAGGFLVVARNPEALAELHGLASVLGPFDGALRNSGELVELRGAEGNVVDSVRYYDGGAWPRDADGGGSSLELVDPRQPNDAGAAWAASDESLKADWTFFEYSGDFPGGEPEIHLFLLGRGSCLVDDISVRSGGTEHIPNGGFEGGIDPWIIDGNHIHSHVTRDDAHAGSRALRVVATGRGDPGANHIEVETTVPLIAGERYTVRFWARWERGSDLLMTRSYNQGFARVGRLSVPARRGTPGSANSTRANPGPVIDRLEQKPSRPQPGVPVEISARIRDADGVASSSLYFRREGEELFQVAPLLDGAQHGGGNGSGGIFTASSPGHADGALVEFFIEARDAEGNVSRLPGAPSSDDPDRVAFLYQVDGSPLVGQIPSYRLITATRVRDELASRSPTSNHLLPVTVVRNDTEIHHRAWLRQRGCFCSRGLIHPPIWRVKVGPDRALGTRDEINLDNQHADPTNQRDRITYYLMRKLGTIPYATSRYVRVYRNGIFDKVYEDVDKVDRDFIEASFGDRDGPLFKVDGWFEFPDSGPRYEWRPASLVFHGEDPEQYRWRYKNRGREELDDFSPLIDFIRFMDPTRTDDVSFDREAERRLVTDNWLRSVTVRVLVDAWDSLGVRGGKNAFLYQFPETGQWWMLPFDNDATFGNDRTTPLVTSSFPSIRRFVQRPAYVREYFRAYRELLDGPFRREHLDPILDETYELLRREAPTSPPTAIKSFVSERAAFVESQITDAPVLRILTNGGNPVVTDRTEFTLLGEAPLKAVVFFVNGDRVEPLFFSMSRFRVRVVLRPGANDLVLIGRDASGVEVGRDAIRITSTAEPEEPVFLRGDGNGDGRVDLSDAVAVLNYLFAGGVLDCGDTADVDDDGEIVITDPIRILNHLFLGEPGPAPPYPKAGTDPTPDELGCEL